VEALILKLTNLLKNSCGVVTALGGPSPCAPPCASAPEARKIRKQYKSHFIPIMNINHVFMLIISNLSSEGSVADDQPHVVVPTYYYKDYLYDKYLIMHISRR
jgi:hypothetical protein